jgi:hypothetical protein
MGGFGRYRGGEEESEADAEHKIPRAKNTELLIFFSLLTFHFYPVHRSQNKFRWYARAQDYS